MRWKSEVEGLQTMVRDAELARDSTEQLIDGILSPLSGWREQVNQWEEEVAESGGSSSGTESGDLGSSPSSHTHSAGPVLSSSSCLCSLNSQPALIFYDAKSWREKRGEGPHAGRLKLEHYPLTTAVTLGEKHPFSQSTNVYLSHKAACTVQRQQIRAATHPLLGAYSLVEERKINT